MQKGKSLSKVSCTTLSKFSEDLITESWVLDIERHHIHDAQELILRYGLRTLDSLQLSSS